MKKTTLAITAAALLLAVGQFSGCKKSEVETATLTVIVSEGVSGTPAAGEYTVQVGDEQSYSFSLEGPYDKLTVILDGKEIAASGSFTITGNHVLQAYSDDNVQFRLIVTVEEGVVGTPAAGTYLYKKGTQIPYSYAPAEGYSSLSVKLDGVETTASGTVTMTEDYTLYASAAVKRSVLGSWDLREIYNDGSSFQVVVTFSGTLFSGTVSDSEGGTGTYDYSDDTLDFNLKFPDVTYEYSDGEFSDDNTMSGSCKRYRTADNAASGTWTATRRATTAATQAGKGSKGKR